MPWTFPVQLLVRQHQPVLDRLRDALREDPARGSTTEDKGGRRVPQGPAQGNLRAGKGVLDRRFYVVCRHDRAGDMASLLSRVGLFVQPLKWPDPQDVHVLASTRWEAHRRDMDEDEPVGGWDQPPGTANWASG